MPGHSSEKQEEHEGGGQKDSGRERKERSLSTEHLPSLPGAKSFPVPPREVATGPNACLHRKHQGSQGSPQSPRWHSGPAAAQPPHSTSTGPVASRA